MRSVTRVDLTPEHLRSVRSGQKAASVGKAKQVLASLMPDDSATISIAELVRRSGLAARTLRRTHVRTLVEAALGRPIGTGRPPNADVDPLLRQIASLRLRLDKEKRLREKDRAEIAAKAETVAELRRLVDLLSHEAREEIG